MFAFAAGAWYLDAWEVSFSDSAHLFASYLLLYVL